MKKRILALVVGLWASVSFVACSSYNSSNSGSSNGTKYRVLAAQGVQTSVTFGALVTIDGQNDTLPRTAPLATGSFNLMAVSPSRNVVAAFDASSNSVNGVSTATEKSIGNIHIQGATISLIVPTDSALAYAAVPSATVSGFSFVGAVDVVNFANGGLTAIAVPSAQTVVSNTTGTQLLVFSSDSDAITVLSPAAANPPVDTSCLPPSFNPAVCAFVQDSRLSRPVNAIISGTTAYVLNCGFECGGTQQASVALVDLGSLTVTGTIPVNGATYALLNGSTLYVAGKGTPTGPLCSTLTNSINPATAATFCGTLDIVDLNTMTDPYFGNPATEIAIPDGYYQRMDLTQDGQLFIGSRGCTNIGNPNNPSGEVRGCLAIYNTFAGASYNTVPNTLIIPPDNGDVNGLQGFTTRYVEYVAEGGNLRVYDTRKDILYINSDFLPLGTIDIVGYVGDVKAIDFF